MTIEEFHLVLAVDAWAITIQTLTGAAWLFFVSLCFPPFFVHAYHIRIYAWNIK